MLVQPEKELISGKALSRSSDGFSAYFAAGSGAEAMWAAVGRPTYPTGLLNSVSL